MSPQLVGASFSDLRFAVQCMGFICISSDLPLGIAYFFGYFKWYFLFQFLIVASVEK